MNVAGVAATVAAPALLQGALVALPRGNALASLRRLRSPAWAAVLPGSIVAGTFAPLGGHSVALGMIGLAVLATPPLAVVAVLAVVRGPRAAVVSVALAAAILAVFAGGLSRELSETCLTALGALALGAALARLIPSRWALAGFICMCAFDVAFLAAGVGQPAADAVARAAAGVPGPMFDRAQLGPVSLDYPDLVLAAVLGGFLAGQRGQRCAATLVTVLAAICFVLVPSDVMCPATVPAAMTLIALRAIGLPRRPEIEALVLEPASP
jgi:hypothetical protein